MGYIRTNEDYYRSLGHSQKEAAILAEADKRGKSIDEGVCNPLKLKYAKEVMDEIAEDLDL